MTLWIRPGRREQHKGLRYRNASSQFPRLGRTHLPCLGLESDPPYAAGGGEQFVNRNRMDELKQRIPLLDYLPTHPWQPARSIRGGRFMGLCPLHTDRTPRFLVDPDRNL